MKEQQFDALQERSTNTRKVSRPGKTLQVGTPNVKGGKYKGNPYMKFKKVKTEPRQKIRQLLRASIPLEELKSFNNILSPTNR